jgi:prolyl-tRNA synthetase
MSITRWSRSFVPTLKEAPTDAVVPSHQLLVRAAFLRQLGAGLYNELPLARRTLAKIEHIVREEMDAIGAQEFQLPALHPAELWLESGRWSVMGDNLFRLKDRKGADHCLGMTHEEIFTAIARDELRSYRQLPQVWYQIQRKFRDEARPKSGLLRVREFTMKDAYSFDLDREGLDRAYEDQRRAYQRIFRRCGLSFVAVQAHSGSMGGSESTEFMVRTDAGEDNVASCTSCAYAANVETARSQGPIAPVPGVRHAAPRSFPTPGVRTIDALAAPPYSRPAAQQLKTLVFVADGRSVIAVVRGDDTLNEAKLQTAVGASELRPAHPEEVHALMGADPGSLGAVGVRAAPVLVDRGLRGAVGMVTGANHNDVHLEGVEVDRDLATATFHDLRVVRAGEGCPSCGATLEVYKALEIGHIFKLGTKYSEALGATVLDKDGQHRPIVMGSYGIGIGRIMAAAVEQHHDALGIRWPLALAPFQVALLTLGPEPELAQTAERLSAELDAAGIEVFFDDRDERAGVKFKDADLLGLPIRIAVGRRSLEAGAVELKLRHNDTPETVAIVQVVARVQALVRELSEPR